MASHELQIKKSDDLASQIEQLLQREMQYNQSRSTLQSELEDATDFIIHLEEKVYKANKTALEVMKQLKDCK